MDALKLSRRSFLTLAAATGAAAAYGGSTGGLVGVAAAAEEENVDDVKVIRTCCRACGKMECGVWVTVQNGRAIKIEGDESSFHSGGNCCSKSRASIQAAYHPDRLLYPMKRTNPKGEDPGWVRITWDEAFEASAEALHEIVDKYGAEATYTLGGTSRVYAMSTAVAIPQMLGTPNRDGALQICKGPRLLAGAITNDMGMFWMENTMYPKVYVQWGTAVEYSNYDDAGRVIVDVATKAEKHVLVDPRITPLGKEADWWLGLRPGTDAAMALAWTKVVCDNDLYDATFVKRWTNGPMLVCDDMEPSGGSVRESMGTLPFMTKILKESDIVEGGSPLRFMAWDNLNDTLTYWDNNTHTWEGETWTPQTSGVMVSSPIPGVADAFLPDPSEFNPLKDPALYGTFEVTLKDGTTVSARPVWERYMEIVDEYTPEYAEEVCGVPASDIEAACLAWATRIDPSVGNGGIHYQLPVDQCGNAINTIRTLILLSAITGNTDIPAGNRGQIRVQGFGDDPGMRPMWPNGRPTMTNMEKNAKMVGVDKYPLSGYFDFWADSSCIADAIITGEPYPIYGLVHQTGNHMNQSNSLYKWEALKKLDFQLSIDLWHAPTTDTADILLPAQHWLECEGSPRMSQGSAGGIGCSVKCIEPPGETKYDIEITVKLFEAYGVAFSTVTDNPYPSVEEVLDNAIGDFNGGTTWKEFSEGFQERGWMDPKAVSPRWAQYRRWETGQLRQQGSFGTIPVDGNPGFMTPTGLTEIWSVVAETLMPSAEQEALPRFVEPYKSPVSTPELMEEYPFILTTGSRNPTYFHSEHRQLPWCRELWPVPRVEINPDDAEELGIEQGDWVWIENANGKVRQAADLYYGIGRGVVNANHTWWYPEADVPGHGFELSAINCLVNKDDGDPFCGSSTLRAYPVKIYKATSENSPYGNPVPVDSSGAEVIVSADDPRLKEWLPTYEGRE